MKFYLICAVILLGNIVECRKKLTVRFKNARFVKSWDRILNGNPAITGQFPWHVSVIGLNIYYKQTLCSGSILNQQWIITAAHCVFGNSIFYIGMGNVTLRTPNVIKTSNTSYMHPKYNDNNLQYDCALIKVSIITYNSNTRPVKLPTTSNIQNYSYLMATISGWGLKDNTSLSDYLLWTNVTTMTNNKCAEIYGPVITDSILCAIGPIAQPKDVCNGDSGGALIIYYNQTVAIQIGIVSFTAVNGCGSGYPSGYTRITYFLGWISGITGMNLG